MSSAASTIDPLNPELWNQVYSETCLRESGWLESFKAWQKLLLPLGVATITILTVREEGGGKGQHFMDINNYKSSKYAPKILSTHTLRESEREREWEKVKEGKREREPMTDMGDTGQTDKRIINYRNQLFFTNLSLMTSTATLNTPNKNINNCGKLKYTLKTKQKSYYCLKLRNIQTQQSKTTANLNFQERETDKNETDR